MQAGRLILLTHILFGISLSLYSLTALSEMNTQESFDDFPVEFEPEITLFDVYLGESFQAEIIMTYTEEWFEIDEPRDLIDQMELVENKQGLESLITGRIPIERTQQGFGTISFDLNTFRLILDIEPKHLVAKALGLSDRIPDPQNAFSLQHEVTVASSGNVSGDLSSSLTHRTLASIGKFWLRNDATVSEADDGEDEYIVTDLALSALLGDYEIDAGLLETSGRLFASSANYFGGSIRSSENVYLDQERLRGSALEIFVPSRSSVQFFRGDRLLSVQLLEFGLQEVDTSAFPQGSYDVEIVFKDGSEEIRRETRFFTKSGLLGVRSRPIFFARGGVLRDQLDLLSDSIYEAGVKWRALSSVQLDLGVYGTEEQTLGGFDIAAIYKDITLTSSYTHSSDDDVAISASLSGAHDFVSWGVNYSDAIRGFDEELAEDSELPSTLSPGSDEFDLLSSARQSLRANLTFRFEPVELRFSANRAESLGAEDTYAYGPRVEWKIREEADNALSLIAEYLDTESGDRFVSFLTYRRKFDDWSFNTTTETRFQDQGDIQFGRINADYDGKATSGKGLRARLQSEVRREENKKDANPTIRHQAEVDYAADYFQTRSFINDSRNRETDETNFGANLESSFQLDSDAKLSVSRPLGTDAALIAEVQSGTTESGVHIIVNGQIRDTVEAGEKTVIGLSPYRTYAVSIRPDIDADIVSYDADQDFITVFPGNIVRKVWSLDRVFIALGTLRDPKGDILPWKRIKGPKGYAVTEEDGSFQLELVGGEKLTASLSEGECELELPDFEVPEYFIDFGDISCR